MLKYCAHGGGSTANSKKTRTSSQSSNTSSLEEDAVPCQTSPTTILTVEPPAPTTEQSVAFRRWNSFHSTRGECHPNKFRGRRERKSLSPCDANYGGCRNMNANRQRVPSYSTSGQSRHMSAPSSHMLSLITGQMNMPSSDQETHLTAHW